MNLNLHIVNAQVDCSFDRDLETAAFTALMTDDSSEESLMALAELVDWEVATMGALTGQGKRCERALKQRVLGAELCVLVNLAGRSACINELFQQLTREAEALDSFHRLCA